MTFDITVKAFVSTLDTSPTGIQVNFLELPEEYLRENFQLPFGNKLSDRSLSRPSWITSS